MEVGQLFINLGIKGSDKTVDSLTNVKKGMGETKSMSLEMKAAILSAFYGLEKLMSMSMQTGTSLNNFNTLTGISAQTLQQWQYAARQAGISGDEMASSFKTAQSIMTKMLMGQAHPMGLSRVALLTGGITKEQIDEMAKDPVKLMQRLQEYALKEQNIGLRNETLKSFGLSEGVITAMSKNAFRPDVFKRAPTYSDKEISSLSKADVAWANLNQKIQMAMGHLTAKHGQQLIQDFSNMVTVITRLADAVLYLVENLKILKGISFVFSDLAKTTENFNAAYKKEGGFFGALGERASAVGNAYYDMVKDFAKKLDPNVQTDISPNVKPMQAPSKNQNINIKQDLHFQHDGKDHKKTSSSVHKAVQDSFRQLSAQGQGS